MSINYQVQDNYAGLAESITTAGRPVSCLKENKERKKQKQKSQTKKPSTPTEEQSKEEGVHGTLRNL